MHTLNLLTTSFSFYAGVYATKLRHRDSAVWWNLRQCLHCTGSSCLSEDEYWFIGHPQCPLRALTEVFNGKKTKATIECCSSSNSPVPEIRCAIFVIVQCLLPVWSWSSLQTHCRWCQIIHPELLVPCPCFASHYATYITLLRYWYECQITGYALKSPDWRWCQDNTKTRMLRSCWLIHQHCTHCKVLG